MKKLNLLITVCCLSALSCGKKNNTDEAVKEGNILQKTETANGITYKVFTSGEGSSFKGILVMGSGNDENNPSPGSLDGETETALCKKAAQSGYVAAIVQYRKTAGNADWNGSAKQIGEDYDQCITALSTKYGISKTRSVAGGVSYASFMLLTDISINNTLSYCKGVLAPCGAAGKWNAENFKVPVFSIVCSGNNEGDLAGKALYDAITNPDIKAKSGGVTDNSCNTHCGGNWVDQLFAKTEVWLQ